MIRLAQGQKVRITLATGAEFEGIYANGADSATCRLTMVTQRKTPNSNDIINGTGRRDQPQAMSFQRKEITEARVMPSNQGKNDNRAPNGTYLPHFPCALRCIR